MLSTLPIEVLILIFRKLDIVTRRLTLRLVCRRFASIISNTKELGAPVRWTCIREWVLNNGKYGGEWYEYELHEIFALLSVDIHSHKLGLRHFGTFIPISESVFKDDAGVWPPRMDSVNIQMHVLRFYGPTNKPKPSGNVGVATINKEVLTIDTTKEGVLTVGYIARQIEALLHRHLAWRYCENASSCESTPAPSARWGLGNISRCAWLLLRRGTIYRNKTPPPPPGHDTTPFVPWQLQKWVVPREWHATCEKYVRLNWIRTSERMRYYPTHPLDIEIRLEDEGTHAVQCRWPCMPGGNEL